MCMSMTGPTLGMKLIEGLVRGFRKSAAHLENQALVKSGEKKQIGGSSMCYNVEESRFRNRVASGYL